jgi:hypothetical protein
MLLELLGGPWDGLKQHFEPKDGMITMVREVYKYCGNPQRAFEDQMAGKEVQCKTVGKVFDRYTVFAQRPGFAKLVPPEVATA